MTGLRFSQRKGIVPVKNAFQIDSIDTELRNGIWNALTLGYWEHMGEDSLEYRPDHQVLMIRLWLDFFKARVEDVPGRGHNALSVLRDYFFSCKWYEVYDFIEFVVGNFPSQYHNEKFMAYCNVILEREQSAYRFVDGVITQITEHREIEAIEEALDVPPALRPMAVHLRTSLELLSDRKSPNYRIAIKEAISAVETISNVIGGSKTTLGVALDRLATKVTIHPALKRGFENLYGWTSDAEGIRHALMEEPNLKFEDAKYMLVSCSAFINYLRAKAAAASIKFS